MANIRIDVNYTIKDGSEIVFRSPVDCSRVTGLKVYYPAEDGNATSKEFALADAHGNNVGDIPNLFAENVVVKVILDVTSGMAFVQNADTNAYLEGRFKEMLPKEELPTAIDAALEQAKASGEFKGEKGDKGDTGATGPQGEQGIQGEKGADGTSVTVKSTNESTEDGGINTVNFTDGTHISIKNGSKGSDGTSVTVTEVVESTIDGANNVVKFSNGLSLRIKNGSKGSTGETGAKGDKGDKGDTGTTGATGEPGYTPVKGVDYFTDADKNELVNMVITQLGGSPIFGVVDENNNIILNGNLADGTYTVKYEMEDGSTVDIGNMVLDSNVYYSVTNNLTNCTNGNSATEAVEGGSYSATISANSGYELSSVVVTMGGADITSSAVSGGTINIANVTGNIVITAVATETEVTPSYTNFADPSSSDWKTDYRLTTNINQVTALTGGVATNYINIQTNDIVEVSGINFADSNNRQAFNGSFGGIAKAEVIASTYGEYFGDVSYDSNNFKFTVLCDSTQARFSGLATGTSADVVVKITRNGVLL